MNIRLKEIMKEKGVTGRELALRLNTSPQYISNVVSGRQNMSLESLENVANLLEVELWELFKAPDTAPPLHSLTCPHCGKSIEIEIRKGSE